MSSEIERALRKQRLLLRSAALRDELAGHAAGLRPVFVVGDRLRSGTLWLRAHPKTALVASAVLLVLRPRSIARWLRRGVAAWHLGRRVHAWFDGLHPAP